MIEFLRYNYFKNGEEEARLSNSLVPDKMPRNRLLVIILQKETNPMKTYSSSDKESKRKV